MLGPQGSSNASLIMSTCRADGVLLKPDRPAFPPNAFFLQHRGKGEVQLTATHIGAGEDRMGWSFCLSFAMGDDVELSAAELGLEAGSVGVAWRRSNLEPFQVAASALQRFGPGKPPLSFAMQVILPPCTCGVERRAEFGALGSLAGCFLAPGSGLGLVGTASSRR